MLSLIRWLLRFVVLELIGGDHLHSGGLNGLGSGGLGSDLGRPKG